jgi:hypothetical protein
MTKTITRWNILALLVLVVGGCATYFGGQLWVHYWARSGTRVPLGVTCEVDLPGGDMLVYYETAGRIPDENVLLYVENADGKRVTVWPNANEDNDYRLALSGWTGRSLWQLNGVVAGTHRVEAFASRHLSDKPTSDAERVVFGKQPNTIAEVDRLRKRFQIICGGTALSMAIGLYVLHGVSLHRRKKVAS